VGRPDAFGGGLLRTPALHELGEPLSVGGVVKEILTLSSRIHVVVERTWILNAQIARHGSTHIETRTQCEQ
jgi:hypothetical protein